MVGFSYDGGRAQVPGLIEEGHSLSNKEWGGSSGSLTGHGIWHSGGTLIDMIAISINKRVSESDPLRHSCV